MACRAPQLPRIAAGAALAAILLPHGYLAAQHELSSQQPDDQRTTFAYLSVPSQLPASSPLPSSSRPTPREQVLQHAVQEARALLHLGPMQLSPTQAATWTTNQRAIEWIRPAQEPETWEVGIHLERRTTDGRFKSGEAYTRLPEPLDASTRSWRLTGEIRVPHELIGNGREEYLTPMRARWVMRDHRGRRCFGPNTGCSFLPDAWVPIAALVPTREAPIPKGLIEEGFDLAAIEEIGINLEAGNISQGVEITGPQRLDYRGTVTLRHIRLEPLPITHPDMPVPPVLYPSAEAEVSAALQLRERLRQRLHLRAGEMAVLVNLAWPFREGRYHTYGTSLGRAPWGDHWGFSSPATEQALREDLRYLSAHGIRVVRVFLFGDFRTGLRYDATGKPIAFDPLVYQDMERLLVIARQEQVLLIPSLVDFLVADGVTHEGPKLCWAVGEHPELITDSTNRAALVRLLAQFVKDFNGPEVLAWEIMNEPDNTVAVATPASFNSLRWFVHDLAQALHREGILTTLGVRHVGDYQRFWRGAVDVPQVHHWRLLESFPNPYAVDTPASELGPLPSMVSEVEPVPPEEVGPLLDRLRNAGYLLAGFWSLRGHDGYAYKPIADAVKEWIDAQAPRGK